MLLVGGFLGVFSRGETEDSGADEGLGSLLLGPQEPEGVSGCPDVRARWGSDLGCRQHVGNRSAWSRGLGWRTIAQDAQAMGSRGKSKGRVT